MATTHPVVMAKSHLLTIRQVAWSLVIGLELRVKGHGLLKVVLHT